MPRFNDITTGTATVVGELVAVLKNPLAALKSGIQTGRALNVDRLARELADEVNTGKTKMHEVQYYATLADATGDRARKKKVAQRALALLNSNK